MSEQQRIEQIVLPDALANFRRFPMNGALLLFDRNSGLNALCEGVETVHLVQHAPRMVQFGITNLCNLACTFCSRDLKAISTWSAQEAFDTLAELAACGVLEVAFGGGEPWAFSGFADLVCRLYEETPLAINFTTNGLAMTPDRLESIKGKYGQLRLSLYDNNDWRNKIIELVRAQASFGINYLVTPERLPQLEATVLELASLGCRDILLLSYNGPDLTMHIYPEDAVQLKNRIALLARAMDGQCQIKLDVCWGNRMAGVPRLFDNQDCGAGRDFMVLTSDKKIQPCSFHNTLIPFENATDIMNIWRNSQHILGQPASLPGCARTAGFGLTPQIEKVSHGTK